MTLSMLIHFLNTIGKTWSMTEINDKLDFTKIQHFCSSKGTYQENEKVRCRLGENICIPSLPPSRYPLLRKHPGLQLEALGRSSRCTIPCLKPRLEALPTCSRCLVGRCPAGNANGAYRAVSPQPVGDACLFWPQVGEPWVRLLILMFWRPSKHSA